MWLVRVLFVSLGLALLSAASAASHARDHNVSGLVAADDADDLPSSDPHAPADDSPIGDEDDDSNEDTDCITERGQVAELVPAAQPSRPGVRLLAREPMEHRAATERPPEA